MRNDFFVGHFLTNINIQHSQRVTKKQVPTLKRLARVFYNNANHLNLDVTDVRLTGLLNEIRGKNKKLGAQGISTRDLRHASSVYLPLTL